MIFIFTQLGIKKINKSTENQTPLNSLSHRRKSDLKRNNQKQQPHLRRTKTRASRWNFRKKFYKKKETINKGRRKRNANKRPAATFRRSHLSAFRNSRPFRISTHQTQSPSGRGRGRGWSKTRPLQFRNE